MRRGFHVKAAVSFALFFVFLWRFVVTVRFVEQRESDDDRPVAESMVRVSWDVMTGFANAKRSEGYVNADERAAKRISLSFRNNETNKFMLIPFRARAPAG